MNSPGLKEQQQRKIRTQAGFLAALDQSGGSTPKALLAYGIKQDAWSNQEQMLDLVHQMRARIITSSSFNGDRILGAILFEGTMDRDIDGRPTADYLWNQKRVVPFLKVDKGLADESDGVRLMVSVLRTASGWGRQERDRLRECQEVRTAFHAVGVNSATRLAGHWPSLGRTSLR